MNIYIYIYVYVYMYQFAISLDTSETALNERITKRKKEIHNTNYETHGP